MNDAPSISAPPPLLDSIDLSSITFSDIWGGFDEQVITASDRYKVDSILIDTTLCSFEEQVNQILKHIEK